ncbi:MAG: sigma-70 family RNA polymerase sigma factor [Hyphomonadaceae bacterium]|nr:sigma-70 family RNA polymerase sigma factor [Hyphomonadaceae bacterium]
MPDAEFKTQLALLIPHLRAFARSLATRQDGDDIAQEAMMRAWASRASYQPGTNMKAWVFTILRNHFLSIGRRAWRNVALDPAVAEHTLVANDDPSASEELLDVRNAMQLLPHDQREALILAGPAGLTYEETAKICGCAIGTVKSRVSRARATLAAILEQKSAGRRAKTSVSSTNVFEEIMADAANTQRRLEMTP